MADEHIQHINSISEVHQLLGIEKPTHPLISLFKIEDFPRTNHDAARTTMNLYSISIKKNVKNKVKYGQHYYDFDEGVMGLMAPGQIFMNEGTDMNGITGLMLLFHPDFVRNHPLGKRIKDYGFYAYAVNEALHLSDQEEQMIFDIMENIQQEYRSPIDMYSQDVMVSHLEVLHSYINRFYNRQFITRKMVNTDLLERVDELLSAYLDNEELIQQHGLPTVQYLSHQLNMSPNYLSDMLRKWTGQSTQKHIQDKLVDRAKDYLITTPMTVSEIAYGLGFEHPQSFSKLFKSKTTQSPLEYRSSFH